MSAILILDDSETTSAEFTAASQFNFVIDGYAGGPWESQVLSPDGNWITVNSTDFNRDGGWVAPGFPGFRQRFTGGTAGAKIWATGVQLA